MAQHDYNIANQSAPSARTDWNNVLAAILGMNSGSSAPATTAAFMQWADSTSKLRMVRNSGDSAFLIKENLDSDMVNTQSGAYTVLATDFGKVVSVDVSGAAADVAFTAAATLGEGFWCIIKKSDSGTNALTMNPNGSETINAQSTIPIANQHDAWWIFCDGTNFQGFQINISAATQAQMETGTSTSVYVTPARQQLHPSASKGWSFNEYSGGVPAATVSYNVTSLTDTGTGEATTNWGTDHSTANQCSIGQLLNDQAGGGSAQCFTIAAIAAGSTRIKTFSIDTNGNASMLDKNHFVATYGDH